MSRGFESKDKAKTSTDYFSRLKLLRLITLSWAVLLVGRLIYLQVVNRDVWLSKAGQQYQSKIHLAGVRGKIFDTNHQEIAVSVPATSVFVRPHNADAENVDFVALSAILEVPVDSLRKKFASTSKFVWLKRQLPKHVETKLAKHEFAGVGTLEEYRRYYPFSKSASTLIGKVGVDGQGLSGIEATHDKHLAAQTQTYIMVKDALGNKIFQNTKDLSDSVGKDLQLTIDVEINNFCQKQMLKTVREHKAKKAMAILVNADTGEVVSICQAPTVNFNQPRVTSRDALKNSATQAVYEPGSTFKPIVAAIALDEGTVTADQIFDTQNGRLRIGRNTVKDVHGSPSLSVENIVVQSSNVGMSKIAFTLGKEKLYNRLREFGFGEKTALTMPGESSGIFRNYKNWAEIDIATHSFGQGIAVSALQLVKAFSATINGGKLYPLKLVKSQDKAEILASEAGSPEQARVEPTAIRQVISEEVSAKMREILEQVVVGARGTGKRAAIENVLVGGKTGTAQKARTDGRGYEQGAYLASFIGFVDAKNYGIRDRYVLLVMVDEPRGKSIYGGTVAGPAFKNIMTELVYRYSMKKKLAE